MSVLGWTHHFVRWFDLSIEGLVIQFAGNSIRERSSHNWVRANRARLHSRFAYAQVSFISLSPGPPTIFTRNEEISTGNSLHNLLLYYKLGLPGPEAYFKLLAQQLCLLKTNLWNFK